MLSDDDKRKLYDQYGEEGMKERGGGEHHSAADIFSQFFGGMGGFGGFGGGGRRRTKTDDIEFPLSLPLMDFYRGRKKTLKISRDKLCNDCNGKGSLKDGAVKKCTGCKGMGQRIVMQRIGPGMIQQSQQTCPECNGDGEQIDASARCATCNGKKTVAESRQIEVEVTPGMMPGQRIPFEGLADDKPGLETGDLIVVLRDMLIQMLLYRMDMILKQEVIHLMNLFWLLHRSRDRNLRD